MGGIRQELKALALLAMYFIVPSRALGIDIVPLQALIDRGIAYIKHLGYLLHGFLFLDVESNHVLGFVFFDLRHACLLQCRFALMHY